MTKYLFIIMLFLIGCKPTDVIRPEDKVPVVNNLIYAPSKLSPEEKNALTKSLASAHQNYDPVEKMIWVTLNGYNYHTDATSGRFHRIGNSFTYALELLELGDQQYEQRAFDIIERCIGLQDTVRSSRTYGIWGYFLEEPLATKKSPPDFNMADFFSVTLLDIWMKHQQKLPSQLKPIIRLSLIRAAESIQKRDITPSYTNIAIMGTYVTYLVSNLFYLKDMQVYANNRLKRFYDYTLEKGGFTEYNSPTYAITALDELNRMQQHIIEPVAKQMIDQLYYIGWKMIAVHYHSPSGQWAGPHSRAYSSILGNAFYALTYRASNGVIQIQPNNAVTYSRLNHIIPKDLYPFFRAGNYPRTQKDIFEISAPQIIGTTYLHPNFALATANRSSMWNQRRPFLAYWGVLPQPKYLQVRFLHDNYDFSSASFYSQQQENKVLAAINLNLDAGDKHISIDRIKTGKFMVKDLRIRFEFGKQTSEVLPVKNDQAIGATVDGLQFKVQLFKAVFEKYEGRWEKNYNKDGAWWDFVIYSGPEKEFDLKTIKEAVWGFTFSMGKVGETLPNSTPMVSELAGMLKADWQGLTLEIPTQILPLPKNL